MLLVGIVEQAAVLYLLLMDRMDFLWTCTLVKREFCVCFKERVRMQRFSMVVCLPMCTCSYVCELSQSVEDKEGVSK